MEELSLQEMLKRGVHFGHQARRWHPKMKPYIFSIRSGIHIIDLEKTAERLRVAYEFLQSIAKSGGTVLFIATKRQAKAVVEQVAREVKMPYVTERWLGGTLTNFENISRLVRHLQDLRSQQEHGQLAKYTKREQVQFAKEIAELEQLVGGIERLQKLPQAIFMIDLKREKTALREARKMKVPVVAMVDTNCNPDLVEYPIPTNDDASKAIEFIVQFIGKAFAGTGTVEPAAAKPEPIEKQEK